MLVPKKAIWYLYEDGSGASFRIFKMRIPKPVRFDTLSQDTAKDSDGEIEDDNPCSEPKEDTESLKRFEANEAWGFTARKFQEVKKQLWDTDEHDEEGKPVPIKACYQTAEARKFEEAFAQTVERVVEKFGKDDDRWLGFPNKCREMMPKLCYALYLDDMNSLGELIEASQRKKPPPEHGGVISEVDGVPDWEFQMNIENVRGGAMLWLLLAAEERYQINLQESLHVTKEHQQSESSVPSSVQSSNSVDYRIRLALLLHDRAYAARNHQPGYVTYKQLKDLRDTQKWINDNLIFATLDIMGGSKALQAVQRPSTQIKSRSSSCMNNAVDSQSSSGRRDMKRRRKAGTPAVDHSSGGVAPPVEVFPQPHEDSMCIFQRLGLTPWTDDSSPVCFCIRGGRQSFPEIFMFPIMSWPDSEFKSSVQAWHAQRFGCRAKSHEQ